MLKQAGYLRVKQAAELLGVSPNTVRAWGAEGKIPEYRHPVNNYRLYRQAELERILRKLVRSRSGEPPVAMKRRPK
jgi:DNA (cytosine-5)-methyltransferase 1